MAAFQAQDNMGRGTVNATDLVHILSNFGERLNRQEGLASNFVNFVYMTMIITHKYLKELLIFCLSLKTKFEIMDKNCWNFKNNRKSFLFFAVERLFKEAGIAMRGEVPYAQIVQAVLTPMPDYVA